MALAAPGTTLATHRVENQPGPAPAADPWASDAALREGAAAAGADAGALAAFGAVLSGAARREEGRAANRYPPELRAFDQAGRRLDEVAFHPAYHALMAAGLSAGYAAVAWEGRPGGHATHAAMVYLMTGVEPGVCCPMTMTYAGHPALGAAPPLAARWQPKLAARGYDPRPMPLSAKAAVTLGMALTEKQGGSDLRATATRAEADGDGHWRLTGHKWFCSAPMSDGLLTLARAPGGLTAFLVPRWLEDGSRNAVRLLRLKDKLGNRANASAEIEFEAATAEPVGEEGAGIRTVLTMVHHTRLDTALAPAGLMRAALIEALHWCRGRRAFGRRLIDAPLMRALLADLALDREATLALGLRIARAFDAAGEADAALARLGVALAKYLANKLCARVVGEAMEAMGGMGYVEETGLPLLWREAPLNGIWEGSGNVIALDILRTLARVPAAAPALADELAAARGASRAYDAALAAHRVRWRRPQEDEARAFAEDTALLLAASVLHRTAPAAVAEAFAATRLGAGRRLTAGAAPGLDAAPLLARLAAEAG